MSPAPFLAVFLASAAPGGAPGPDALARIDTTGSTTELAPGKQGTLVLAIAPTGSKDAPTHLETAFPVRVQVAAPAGVTVASDKLAKKDAARMEKDGIRFEVPLTGAAPGRHEVKAKVDFAVCTEDPKTGATTACYPQKREVAHVVTVK